MNRDRGRNRRKEQGVDRYDKGAKIDGRRMEQGEELRKIMIKRKAGAMSSSRKWQKLGNLGFSQQEEKKAVASPSDAKAAGSVGEARPPPQSAIRRHQNSPRRMQMTSQGWEASVRQPRRGRSKERTKSKEKKKGRAAQRSGQREANVLHGAQGENRIVNTRAIQREKGIGAR